MELGLGTNDGPFDAQRQGSPGRAGPLRVHEHPVGVRQDRGRHPDGLDSGLRDEAGRAGRRRRKDGHHQPQLPRPDGPHPGPDRADRARTPHRAGHDRLRMTKDIRCTTL